MATATTKTAATPAEKLNIVQIISRVSDEAGALAPERTSGVPFAFRGVDAVVSHLAPYLDKYGVIITPEVIDRTTTTRLLDGNKAITQSDLLVKFTFHSPDGSSVSVTTNGLAQDYADRSAAQAQSVAFRVALLQTFHLPTTDKEPEVAGEDTQRYIEKTTADAKGAAPAAKKDTIESLRASIVEMIGSGKIAPEKVNEIMLAETKKTEGWTLADYKKGLTAINAALETS